MHRTDRQRERPRDISVRRKDTKAQGQKGTRTKVHKDTRTSTKGQKTGPENKRGSKTEG